MRFGRRDQSIDAQWRRKNAKAWLVTLLVAALLLGGVLWFEEVIGGRADEQCRDSGGTPVTVRRWEPVNNTGRPRWREVMECHPASPR